QFLKPACVAVELPDTMALQLMHGASRLPDISVVSTSTFKGDHLYYLIEPCDAIFEALRSALEYKTPAFCIDLDLDDYPEIRENFPDPYAIHKIGFQRYCELYQDAKIHNKIPQDKPREI